MHQPTFIVLRSSCTACRFRPPTNTILHLLGVLVKARCLTAVGDMLPCTRRKLASQLVNGRLSGSGQGARAVYLG